MREELGSFIPHRAWIQARDAFNFLNSSVIVVNSSTRN